MSKVSPQELEGLALRCEQASGADRELDAEIAKVVGADYGPKENVSYASRTVQYIDEAAPKYTSSLDHARSLVPSGQFEMVSTGSGTEKSFAQLVHPIRKRSIFVVAASEPLAMTAAALRARALSGIRHEG